LIAVARFETEAYVNAEHLHLALNHVPMIAMAALLLPLGYALIVKQKGLLILLLAMTTVFGAMTFVLMSTGEQAEHRFEEGILAGPALTEETEDLIHEHEERAEITAVVSYATAGLAVVGVVLSIVRLKWAIYVGWATLIAMLVTSLLSVWTSQAGGWIRHPELRKTSTAWAALLSPDVEPTRT